MVKHCFYLTLKFYLYCLIYCKFFKLIKLVTIKRLFKFLFYAEIKCGLFDFSFILHLAIK